MIETRVSSTGNFCCACEMTCNHIGPHSYCAAHSPAGVPTVPLMQPVYPRCEHCFCLDYAPMVEYDFLAKGPLAPHKVCCICGRRRAVALLAAGS